MEKALRNEIMRPVIITMFSMLYKLELKLISKRTKAGLARVRAQGKKIGDQFKLNEKQH